MVVDNLQVGADPELFLEKEGEIISAEGLIGGTKDTPKFISAEGHAIQEDNILVEFNIPPSKTEVEFVDNINFVKDYLDVLVAVQGGKLNYLASAEVNKIHLQTEQAKLFGCEPDFNAYIRDINEPPKAGGNLRTCGGHIHIGYDNASQAVSEKIVFAMDATAGLGSILRDNDDRRKEMYGTAGTFRFKDYGVEYRTLSNFWVKSDESIKWAFQQVIKAIELVNSGIIDSILDNHKDEMRNIIDTNNKVGAATLLEKIEKIKELNLVKK